MKALFDFALALRVAGAHYLAGVIVVAIALAIIGPIRLNLSGPIRLSLSIGDRSGKRRSR